MEVGSVYGSYYGAKGYGSVRKEEKRADEIGRAHV